jgi:hypothetical protein
MRSSGVNPDRVDRQVEQRRGELPDGEQQGSNAPPDHFTAVSYIEGHGGKSQRCRHFDVALTTFSGRAQDVRNPVDLGNLAANIFTLLLLRMNRPE